MRIRFPVKTIHYYWYGNDDYEGQPKKKLSFLLRLVYCKLTKRRCEQCNGTYSGDCMDGTCEYCYIGWDVELRNYGAYHWDEIAEQLTKEAKSS